MLDWLMAVWDWGMVLAHARDLGLAYLLALPIAWDREDKHRTAGIRTFPLVAVATCGYMLIGLAILDSTDAEARVIQGLITGMGFVGGGAILKHKGTVRGTATAASLWSTGATGMAVAAHRFEIAVVIGLITFLTLRFLRPLLGDEQIDDGDTPAPE